MFDFFRKILLIFVLLSLANCGVPNWWKPRGYLVFKLRPKGGSPGYDLGWTHGCQSGLGTQFGGKIYMYFYTWSRDPDITSSRPNIPLIKKRYGKKELKKINWNDPADIKENFDDYNRVFWEAHFFCRQVALGTMQATSMDPPLPGETRYEPGGDSVGNVWKMNGKGDPRWGSTGPSGGLW